MPGFMDWIKTKLGGPGSAGAPAVERPAPSEPEPTQQGLFVVTLDEAGHDRAAILDALLVITPMDLDQVEAALDRLPMTVRIGLPEGAARSIRDRLVSLGGRATVRVEE